MVDNLSLKDFQLVELIKEDDDGDMNCVCCPQTLEDDDHLFCRCNFSGSMCYHILKWVGKGSGVAFECYLSLQLLLFLIFK